MIFTPTQLRNMADLMEKHGAVGFGTVVAPYTVNQLDPFQRFGIELANGDVAMVEDSDLEADPDTSVIMNTDKDGIVSPYKK